MVFLEYITQKLYLKFDGCTKAPLLLREQAGAPTFNEGSFYLHNRETLGYNVNRENYMPVGTRPSNQAVRPIVSHMFFPFSPPNVTAVI